MLIVGKENQVNTMNYVTTRIYLDSWLLVLDTLYSILTITSAAPTIISSQSEENVVHKELHIPPGK